MTRKKFIGALHYYSGRYYMYCKKCASRNKWGPRTIKQRRDEGMNDVWVIYSNQLVGVAEKCAAWNCGNYIGDATTGNLILNITVAELLMSPEDICRRFDSQQSSVR